MFSLNAILAFFLVSMPEEFLMCLGTALLAGKRYVADFTDRKMQVNVWIITFFTALSTILLRFVPVGDLFRTLIQIIIFVALYTWLLRIRWYEVAISFMIYLIGFIVLEYVDSTIMTAVTGLTLDICLKNALLLLLYSLPFRIVQALFAYILDKKWISLPIQKVIKFVSKAYKRLFIVLGCFLFTVIFIFMNELYFIFDEPPVHMSANLVFRLVFNLFYCTVVAVTVISLVIQLSRKEDEKRQDNIASFNYFKGLLHEYNGDIIKITKKLDEGLATFKAEDKKKGK